MRRTITLTFMQYMAHFIIFLFILSVVITYVFFSDNKVVKIEKIAKNQKVIGIIPDYDLAQNLSNNKKQEFYNYHMLRDRYLDNFEKICKNINFIILPISNKNAEKLFSMVDGILIVGGDDIDGKFFNQKTSDIVTDIEPYRRTEFNIKAVKYAMKNNLPLFGICNGMQVINIAAGGDIIQDIPTMMQNPNSHIDKQNVFSYNKINVNKNSWLFNSLKKDNITVNCSHHQAVGKIGKNILVSATSSDGVAEAIECKNCKQPIIGFQWHPEFLMTKNDQKIIKSFCDAVEKS